MAKATYAKSSISFVYFVFEKKWIYLNYLKLIF